MAEILGLGLTHYPPMCVTDDKMPWIMELMLKDPGIPEAVKDPACWPEAMRAEWGADRGQSSAVAHRAALVAEFARVRGALEAFKPDVVLMFGDDQYENFREDLIPAFAILAYDDIEFHPWRHAQDSAGMGEGKPNVWGEGPDKSYKVRGRRDIAKHLAARLIESDFDVAYAYRPLHHDSFPHAFANAMMFLDYDRKLGWDWPTIPFAVNCYGRAVISAKGGISKFGQELDFDPPSPSPARFMDLGRATARILRDSPWRVAIVASSSWSHAFMCDHTWRLQPDIPADRKLYDALVAGDYETWRGTPLASFERSGQQEMLNWCALLGAMEELGAGLQWSSFVQTHVFNSNKVFAIYEPK